MVVYYLYFSVTLIFTLIDHPDSQSNVLQLHSIFRTAHAEHLFDNIYIIIFRLSKLRLTPTTKVM